MINVIGGLAAQVIGLFGQRGKATQEAIQQRISNMERSWTDEFIVLIVFSPWAVAWFDPEHSKSWIDSVMENDVYAALCIGIISAVFGLGKLNGRAQQKGKK